MSFDFTKNCKLTVKCIKKALKKASLKGKDIVSLSATSMIEGIIV